MAVIKLKSNLMKFDFENENGEVVETITFDKSDSNIKHFWEKYKEIQKMQFVEEDEEANFETVTREVKGYMDDLFGEGSFDKLYALNPSILIVSTYFLQMATQIREEIDRDQQDEIIKQYAKKINK